MLVQFQDDKPSYLNGFHKIEVIERSLSVAKHDLEWLSWNDATLEGTLVSVPTREQITENIKEQLIVELYSK